MIIVNNMWYAIMLVVHIFSIRELYIIIKDLEDEKYIYWDKQHSLDHFNYLIVYNFTLLLTWFYVFYYISLNFVLVFWGISTMLLLQHVRSERKSNLFDKK